MNTVLLVGSSPSANFLTWRLSKDPKISTTVAWEEKVGSVSITSTKFGHDSFSPNNVYDLTKLQSIKPPAVTVKEGNKATTADGYDYIILTLSSRRQLSNLAKNLEHVIVPKHTILFVDTSYGLCPIQKVVQKKFPNNMVLSIFTDAPVYRTPTMELVHSTSETSTYVEPPSSSSGALKKLITLFNTGGINAIQISTTKKFLELQWERAIPYIAFQPLSILFDTPNLEKLAKNNGLAKPLYRGVVAELKTVANKQGCRFADDFNPQFLVDNLALTCITPTSSVNHNSYTCINSSASSSASTDSSSSGSSLAIPYLDSPLLYYNFYHSLPLGLDLLLLQPILFADEYKIKVPYLESIFAFISQMVYMNNPQNSTSLFARKPVINKNASLTPQTPSPLTEVDPMDNSSTADVVTKMKALQAREESLIKRENVLYQREHEVYSQMPPNIPPPQQQQPTMSLRGGPKYRVNSTLPPHKVAEAPLRAPHETPDGPGIDMMSLTQRRGFRRSFSSRQMAPGGLPPPPPTPPPGPGVKQCPSTPSLARPPSAQTMYAPPPGPQPFSQQLDLDDVADIHLSQGSRYASVTNNSRRLSSSIKQPNAPPSRSNSMTSIATSQFNLPTPQVSQTNLFDTFNGASAHQRRPSRQASMPPPPRAATPSTMPYR